MFTFTHRQQKALKYNFEILGSFIDSNRVRELKKTYKEFIGGASKYANVIRLYLRTKTDRINKGDILKIDSMLYEVRKSNNRIIKIESLSYVDLEGKDIRDIYTVGNSVDVNVIDSVYDLEELN